MFNILVLHPRPSTDWIWPLHRIIEVVPCPRVSSQGGKGAKNQLAFYSPRNALWHGPWKKLDPSYISSVRLFLPFNYFSVNNYFNYLHTNFTLIFILFRHTIYAIIFKLR